MNGGIGNDRHSQSASLGAAVLCLVLAGMSLPASSAVGTPDQPRQGGTLVVGLVGDPATLNPALPTYNTNTLEIASSLFDTLVAYNRNWDIVPRLARRWVVSQDATSYAFYLAQSAKWHDGRAVTSADVKWTFETILQSGGWAADLLRDVTSIETPNATTVRISLKRPNAAFFVLMAEKGLSILPKHIYEGTDWNANRANLEPVGSGPFKFVQYQKGARVELQANAEYFAGRPYVDRLIFQVVPDAAVTVRQIEAGELDYSTQFAPFGDLPRLRRSSRVRLLNYTFPVIAWLGFKLSKPPFSDPRVRQALAYAINRDELNEKSMHGGGVTSTHLYLENHWATDPAVKLPAYDPERAKALLREAGFADRPLRFSILVYQGFGAPEIVEVIREQLRRVGIEASIEALEFGTYVEKGVRRKDFDVIFRMGFTGPDPLLLEPFIGTGGFQNVMDYKNPRIDELLAQAKAVSNQKQRAAFYSQIQKILLDDLPRLPLFDRRVVFPSNPVFRDFWSDTTTEAIKQAERSFDRAYWTKGKPVVPRP